FGHHALPLEISCHDPTQLFGAVWTAWVAIAVGPLPPRREQPDDSVQDVVDANCRKSEQNQGQSDILQVKHSEPNRLKSSELARQQVAGGPKQPAAFL